MRIVNVFKIITVGLLSVMLNGCFFDNSDYQEQVMHITSKSMSSQLLETFKGRAYEKNSIRIEALSHLPRFVDIPECDNPSIIIEQSKESVFNLSFSAERIEMTNQWYVSSHKDVKTGTVNRTHGLPIIITYCKPTDHK
jgi:hypothetical protein